MTKFKTSTQMQNNIRIAGIDPGYEKCGISIIDKKNGKDFFVDSSCIETSRKQTHAERLQIVGDTFLEWCKKYKPTHIAIETVFFEKNQKTAMKVAEVRGILIYLAQKESIIITEFTPLQVKSAITGHGGGSKKDIIGMIPKLIKVSKDIKQDDEYDAIALAITCSATLRFNSYSL